MTEPAYRPSPTAPPAPPRVGGVVRAPRLPADSGPWFNGERPADWRGRVTLVDFWTYSCINCLRILPALRAWHARYAAHGLAIVGVHTPEFSFERDPANVARALHDLAIDYPVVLDNDRAIWASFANRYWPHRYLIDPAGYIVHNHAGEGGEAATERALRAALAALPGSGTLPAPAFPPAAEDAEPLDEAMGAVCIPGTPELFAGYYRGVSGNPGGFREDVAAGYADPGGYREGYLHLQGNWRVEVDAAHFVGPEPGSLRVAFRGTAPNLVLAPSPGAAGLVEMRVGPLPGAATNTAANPAPGVVITVDRPRLYAVSAEVQDASLAIAPPDRLRLLTLIPRSPGLAVYSFTFGACG